MIEEQHVQDPSKPLEATNMLHPGPDHDFYHHTLAFPLVVYTGLCVLVISSIAFLVALRSRDVRPMDLLNPNMSKELSFTLVPPIFVALGFFVMCVLLSLVMEISRPEHKAKRIGVKFVYLGVNMTCLIMVTLGLSITLEMVAAYTSLYLALSIVHGIRQWRLYRHRAKSVGSQMVLDSYSAH